MSVLRPCVFALLALSITACPAAKPKPDALPSIPKLIVDPALRTALESGDTALIVRIKAGPWTALQPLVDRLKNLPIPFTIRATLKALAEKGPVGALIVLEGEPPENIKKALDMIDTKRDIFVRLSMSTSPQVSQMIAIDNALLTYDQLTEVSAQTSIYIPSSAPEDLASSFKAGLGTRGRGNQYTSIQGYAVLTNTNGVAPKASKPSPLRATPASVRFFNDSTLASVYLRPKRLRAVSMAYGLSQMGQALGSAAKDQAGVMMSYGLTETLTIPSLGSARQIEFEDHTLSLGGAGKDSVVIDAVSTRTAQGRAIFQTLASGAPTQLPSITLSPEQQKNVIVSSEGAMNLPALLDQMRASGALDPKPEGTRRMMSSFARSGYGGYAALGGSPAYLLARFFHEGKRLRDTPILAGRVRLWKNPETGKPPGLGAVFAFRGDDAAAQKLLALARRSIGSELTTGVNITHKTRPDGTFLLMFMLKDSGVTFGADTPATRATATFDINLENFPPGVLPISPSFLGQMRGELLPDPGASYARFEFVGESPQKLGIQRWAYTPVQASGDPCHRELSRSTRMMTRSLRNQTMSRAPLDAFDKAANACIAADAANTKTYRTLQANARWLHGMILESRKDRPGADTFYKEACEMGVQEACEDLKRARWSPAPSNPDGPPKGPPESQPLP